MHALQRSECNHHLAAFVSTLVLVASSGCTICSPGYLDDYATIGGKWQRSNPVEGRIGSPFSDAESPATSAISNREYTGEVIYEDGISIREDGIVVEGMDFARQGGAYYGDDYYYESALEEVPHYEDLGEDW